MNSTKKITYIDIHSHINFPEYDVDRGEILKSMISSEVATITVGTSYESSKSAVALAELNENVYACIGVHPVDDMEPVFDVLGFETLVSSPKVVAIGECGLDYGREGIVDENSKAKQIKIFENQLEFATRYNKPVMIHARNSNKDILDILESKKKEYGDRLKGNVHFFSAGVDEARRYFDIDFSISFTGVVTFTRDYDEVVVYAPTDKIMSETDSPYVSPVPYRGKRNEPTWVIEVVKKIAEIRRENVDIMTQILKNNAVAKFNLLC